MVESGPGTLVLPLNLLTAVGIGAARERCVLKRGLDKSENGLVGHRSSKGAPSFAVPSERGGACWAL